MDAPPIFVLTGAGISAESGLRTFRAVDGLWEDHPISQVATPEGFAADPALVQRFYNERRAHVAKAKPNAAHQALARLEREYPGDYALVTQNIDDLHELAGSAGPIHMHGQINKMRCTSCERVQDSLAVIAVDSPCPRCQAAALRPHIVWFGEMPLRLEEIYASLRRCEVFVAIGTSGQVYPAAGFVDMARAAGARCIEVNLEATSSKFDEHLLGPATAQVEVLVDGLLGRVAGQGGDEKLAHRR